MNHLGNLPSELIVAIVQWMDSKTDHYHLSLINRQFHNVVNPILWRVINVKHQTHLMQVINGLMESKSLVGEHVRRVTLEPSLNDSQLLAIMKHVPYLKKLVIEHPQNITDSSLQHLPSSCSLLKTFELYPVLNTFNPYPRDGVLTQLSVLPFAQHCHQLTTLTLVVSPGISCAALLTLTACPLKKLHISLDQTDNMALLDDLVKLQHLRQLTLTTGSSSFTEQLITTLTHHPDWMPHLNYITFPNCDTLEKRQVLVFLKARPAIDSLGLLESNLSHDFLDDLASSGIKLTLLDLSFSPWFTYRDFRQFILDYPSLKLLALLGCRIDSAGFPELYEFYADDQGFLNILDEDTMEEIRSRGEAGFVAVFDFDDEPLELSREEQQTSWDFMIRIFRDSLLRGADDDDEDKGLGDD